MWFPRAAPPASRPRGNSQLQNLQPYLILRSFCGRSVPSVRAPGQREYPAVRVARRIACLAGGPRPASAPRWLSSIPANETAFETREPEPIPIWRIPGLRDAIEPLNRIIRIRADAAGGFDDSPCALDHSVAFLHGFAALTQTCPEDDLRWADSSLYVLGANPVHQTSP